MPNEPRAPATRAPRRAAACSVCGKPVTPAFRPFCSERCKQVDLGRWLKGTYAIPGGPVEPEDEERE